MEQAGLSLAAWSAPLLMMLVLSREVLQLRLLTALPMHWPGRLPTFLVQECRQDWLVETNPENPRWRWMVEPEC